MKVSTSREHSFILLLFQDLESEYSFLKSNMITVVSGARNETTKLNLNLIHQQFINHDKVKLEIFQSKTNVPILESDVGSPSHSMLFGSTMKCSDTSGSVRKHQELPGSVRKPQEASGRLRKSHEASGIVMKPQEV